MQDNLIHISNKYVAVLNNPLKNSYTIYAKEPIFCAMFEAPIDMVQVGNDWVSEKAIELIEMEVANQFNSI